MADNANLAVAHRIMKTSGKSAYTSEILYHFVGRKEPGNHEQNYSTLRKILSAGCISYHPHMDLDGWGDTAVLFDWNKSLLSQDLIVPTVTCFADIPFNLDSAVKICWYKTGEE
jgi:hypothetical protein